MEPCQGGFDAAGENKDASNQGVCGSLTEQTGLPEYRSLSEQAGVPEWLANSSLPLDFRVHIQVLHGMAQQRQLLQELVAQHEQVKERLDGLSPVLAHHQDMATLHTRMFETLERTEKKIDDLKGQAVDDYDLKAVTLDTAARLNKNGDALQAASWFPSKGVAIEKGAIDADGQRDYDGSSRALLPATMGRSHAGKEAGKSSHSFIPESILRDRKGKEAEDPGHIDDSKPHQHFLEERLHMLEEMHPLTRLAAKMQHVEDGALSNLEHLHLKDPCRANAVKVIRSPWFDVVSALVITTNASYMGISATVGIDFALSHVGERLPAPEPLPGAWQHCFYCFYVVELVLKLYALRCSYFTDHSDGCWNTFDLILVVAGTYDVLMDVLDVDSVNVTWMRMLRLVKMAKMLRVVRVMKIFRQMRTMLKSITESFLTLIWSIMVLVIIMYIFGLCFLFGITGYLDETPKADINESTMENIEAYWSSVLMSLVSLFMALTGGADWEQICEPLKAEGYIYYCLFLFYIAFGLVTVMNVLTGLIVDNAMKASMEDEDEVLTQIFHEDSAHIVALQEIYKDDPFFQEDRSISWQPFMDDLKKSHRKHSVAQKFLTTLEIKTSDAYRVFHMLADERNERVNLDAFITGCSRARGDQTGVELFSLTADAKRLMGQVAVLMHYVEDRFNGLGPCKTLSIKDRLEHMGVGISGHDFSASEHLDPEILKTLRKECS